jgi:hypothetical protein
MISDVIDRLQSALADMSSAATLLSRCRLSGHASRRIVASLVFAVPSL